jgi:hypothetical protein
VNRAICVVGLISWNSKWGTHIVEITQLDLKIFQLFVQCGFDRSVLESSIVKNEPSILGKLYKP